MILGLDCSTSICGWTLLDSHGFLVDISYLNFKKQKDLYEKLEMFREWLLEIDKRYEIDKVFIEEPLMVHNKSMAQVISKLQRFNGMISGAVFSDIFIKPILINASHARKLCEIKLLRGQNTKEIVLDFVKDLNIISVEKWEKKKTGKNKETNFDMADSYIIALAGYKENA